jgi:hypothetical protein
MILHQAIAPLLFASCVLVADMLSWADAPTKSTINDHRGDAPTLHEPPQPASPASGLLPIRVPTIDEEHPIDLPGLRNIVAFHADVWSGSGPEGDAGFDSLQSLGVRTILSVDGALPDLDRARKRGMRYVHLPIGYDGFNDTRKIELARAVRDLPQPIYIHCHHGKHRSAGASAAIAVSLGWLTPDQAAARMKTAGTATGYTGLWQCTAESAPIAAALLDAAPADFPERTMPSSLVAAMVEIDAIHDRLKLAQQAGWRVPTDHPDLAPLADAGRLADLYRWLDDDAQLTVIAVKERAMVRAWLVREGLAAERLEQVLGSLEIPTNDRRAMAARADASLALLGASCNACHQQHRDD